MNKNSRLRLGEGGIGVAVPPSPMAKREKILFPGPGSAAKGHSVPNHCSEKDALRCSDVVQSFPLLCPWRYVGVGATSAADYFVNLSTGLAGNTAGLPTSVNSSGAVTGGAYNTGTPELPAYNAFLYTGGSAGTMNNISAQISSGTNVFGTAINDNGQMAAISTPFNGYYYTGGTAGASTLLVEPGRTTAPFPTRSTPQGTWPEWPSCPAMQTFPFSAPTTGRCTTWGCRPYSPFQVPPTPLPRFPASIPAADTLVALRI